MRPVFLHPTPERFVIVADGWTGPVYYAIHPRADHLPRDHYDVSTCHTVELAWVLETRAEAEAFLALAIDHRDPAEFPGNPRVSTVGMARFRAEDARMQPAGN